MSMLFDEPGIIICGVTNERKKFRPSDWVERIASDFASFDQHKLHYCTLVKPVMHSAALLCLSLSAFNHVILIYWSEPKTE